MKAVTVRVDVHLCAQGSFPRALHDLTYLVLLATLRWVQYLWWFYFYRGRSRVLTPELPLLSSQHRNCVNTSGVCACMFTCTCVNEVCMHAHLCAHPRACSKQKKITYRIPESEKRLTCSLNWEEAKGWNTVFEGEWQEVGLESRHSQTMPHPAGPDENVRTRTGEAGLCQDGITPEMITLYAATLWGASTRHSFLLSSHGDCKGRDLIA
jgi:hypothetical protein